MTEQQGVPKGEETLSWPGLLQETDARLDRDLRLLLESDLKRAIADRSSGELAARFGSLGDRLARVAVVRGARACWSVAEAYNPLFPEASIEVEPLTDSAMTADMLKLLAYLNAVWCCGTRGPTNAETLEQRWLPLILEHKRDLYEEKRNSTAFAAVAAGMAELTPALIGGPLTKRVKAGARFGGNLTGFIRYLASAIAVRVEAPTVMDAWYDFVNDFPVKLAAETCKWSDLLWCARAVMVHIEHRPVETVADALHELVTTEFA